MEQGDKTTFEQIFPIIGGDFGSSGTVSCHVKEILRKVGVSPSVIRRVAITVYEAEMNVVLYTKGGLLKLKITPERIELIVEDRGDGIPDIELAMQEGYSTATSMIREMGFGSGMGLPNIRKNVDFLKITSVTGEGTKLEAFFETQSSGRTGEYMVFQHENTGKQVAQGNMRIYTWRRNINL